MNETVYISFKPRFCRDVNPNKMSILQVKMGLFSGVAFLLLRTAGYWCLIFRREAGLLRNNYDINNSGELLVFNLLNIFEMPMYI